MRIDKPAAAAAAIYVAIAVVAGGVSGYFMGQHAGKKAAITRSVQSAASHSKRTRTAWAELEQSEVDALTERLKTIAARKPVQIVCADRAVCGDLALDLENAFESAKWEVVVVAPFMAEAEPAGVRVSSDAVAAAIAAATALPVTQPQAPDPAEETVSVHLGKP